MLPFRAFLGRLIKNICESLANTKCKLCVYSKLLRHNLCALSAENSNRRGHGQKSNGAITPPAPPSLSLLRLPPRNSEGEAEDAPPNGVVAAEGFAPNGVVADEVPPKDGVENKEEPELAAPKMEEPELEAAAVEAKEADPNRDGAGAGAKQMRSWTQNQRTNDGAQAAEEEGSSDAAASSYSGG
nr:uncharacterized protein LOC112733219 [Arachis hypogaea]